MDRCNTIVSFWGPAYFQVRTVSFRERSFLIDILCCSSPGLVSDKDGHEGHRFKASIRSVWFLRRTTSNDPEGFCKWMDSYMTCLRGIEPSQSIYLSDLYHTSLHGICSKTYNVDRSICIKPIYFYVPTGCLSMLSPCFLKLGMWVLQVVRWNQFLTCKVGVIILQQKSWWHSHLFTASGRWEQARSK